jgi:hypothetical protein
MPLTNNQLMELHMKCVRNLDIKLAKVPARVFPSGRKPTISDIYL